MSEYTLSNSAAVIDSAITRVASADSEPTANSQNMVTSTGIKAYVDTEITDIEAGFDTGYTDLTNSGTVSSAGFLIIQVGGVANDFATVSVSVQIGSTYFSLSGHGVTIHLTSLPISKGDSYNVIASSSNNQTVPITVKFKKLKLT